MSRFLGDPYFWVTLSAIFFAASISRATRRTHGDIKWTLVTIYLSMTIALAICAVFIPGPEKILDIKLLYLFSAVTVIFFLGFRFRKSIGFTLFLLFLIVVFSFIFFLQGFSAFTGEREIATVKILDLTGSDENTSMKMEISRQNREDVIVALKGEYFAPIVKEVIFDDYFVFLGVKTWYRLEGITAFSFKKENDRMVLKQTDTGYYFPFPTGISEKLYLYFETYEKYIPGVKTVQIDINAKRARKMVVFSILLQNDGGIQIVEK